MKKMKPCDQLIAVAEDEIGYLEKRSNSNLDSKTGNAGSNNYTKYNRDLKAWTDEGYIAAQWCQSFVDWCFIVAFGVEMAEKLLGVFTNYTPEGSDAFKKRGRYIKRGKGTPKRGDVIYFYSSAKGRIGHVGIVIGVSGSTVRTIEGNTSGASSLVTNGGGVRQKSYSMSSTYIDGYGSVDYSIVGDDAPESVTLPTARILKNGCVGDDVVALQNALRELGYDLGSWGCDGDFGDCTELAVRKFQTQMGLVVDGQAGPMTMAALRAALEAHNAPVADPAYVKIVGGNCFVREAPNTDGDKMGVAYEGSQYIYNGKTSDNGWHMISYKERAGWVSGKYGRLVQ